MSTKRAGPLSLNWGIKVVVSHVTVRVIADRTTDHHNLLQPEFRTLYGRRFQGRYAWDVSFGGERTWPGAPLPSPDFDVRPPTQSYEPEPDPTDDSSRRPFIRLRRLPHDAVGIVIGDVKRHEGRIQPRGGEDDGWLDADRTTRLYEVALSATGKGIIVLAWPGDVRKLGEG